MWGAIAGAALSTLGSLWGGNQAAKAEQRKKKYVEDELKDNENWWRRVLARIKEALRKLGFNVKFTDADINYLLWKAEDKLRAEGKGVFDRAEDINRRSQAEREAREERRHNAESVLSKVKGQKAIGGIRGEEGPTLPDIDMDESEPLAARGDDGDARFRVGNKRRAEMERRLDKRRADLSQEEKEALFDYLDTLDDTKLENATFDWFVKGTIRLPEDMDKVRQAVEVAGKAKVDPAKYGSPMELLNTHADFKPTKPRINPDDVPTLTNKKDYGNGITVYDVDESEDSRKNMRAIIDTHWGEDANPWCLLSKNPRTGEFYPASEGYWHETYNAYGKKVAFKDGKLLAFFASDGQPTWWDRNDGAHTGIPVTGKMRGDKEGRSATYEYKIPVGDIVGLDDMYSLSPDDPTGYFDRDWKRNYGEGDDWGGPMNMYRGNKENGKYEEWYDNGQKKWESHWKDGETNGEFETWYANGTLQEKGFSKSGKGEGHYEAYYEDGSIKRRAEFRNGIPIRDENFYQDGQLESECGTKDGKGGYWKKAYYANGQLAQHDYWDDKGFYHQIYYHGNGQKSLESTSRGGSERYGDYTEWYENGQIKEKRHYNDEGELDGEHVKYNEDGSLQFREFYKDGKREGLQERWGIDNYIVERVNYKNGRKEGIEEQYFHHDIFHPERRVPNEIRVRTEYKNGVRDGVEEKYWLNGSLHEFVEYKDGKENGGAVKWNEDGTLFSYSEYKDGKLRGFAAVPIAGQESGWFFYEIGGWRDEVLPAEEGEKMLAERMKIVEEKIAKATEGSSDVLFREGENRDEGETKKLADIITNRDYEKKELSDNERRQLEKINETFNEKLSTLNEANADEVYLSIGKPSSILRDAGVHDKEMKLYGNKVMKKVRKHGFGPQELRDLVINTADPIAVFNNKGVEGNRSILTELRTKDGNFLVTVELGKGVDVDFNIVSSVFGKGDDKIGNWLKKGYDTYINKEKALNYLYYPAPIAETPRSSRLNFEGKGSENFGNSKENGENLRFREEDEEPRTLVGVHNISEEKLRKGIRLGGSVNPSIAVFDTAKNYKHTGYGEISFIVPSEMLEGEDTFIGDAWTPHFPDVERRMSEKGEKQLQEDLDKVPDEMRQSVEHHGDERERLRGQVPITEEDFEKIPDIVENYDTVEYEGKERGNDVIRYSKAYDDGTVIYLEEVRNGRGELALKTFWKTKGSSKRLGANRTNATQIPSSVATSEGKGSENFGNSKENGENLRFREEDEEETPKRPSGPLRPGEGIFDRAEAVSRDYMAELERARKSREEAKAERPKEEREYIQAQEVKIYSSRELSLRRKS